MADIGLYSLRFALVIAVLGVGAGIYAGSQQRPDWTRVAERAVWVVLGFTSLAIFSLFYALGNNDFSIAYVAQHSARSMALGYRLAALWGGQAGSLLLWAWMLTAYAQPPSGPIAGPIARSCPGWPQACWRTPPSSWCWSTS